MTEELLKGLLSEASEQVEIHLHETKIFSDGEICAWKHVPLQELPACSKASGSAKFRIRVKEARVALTRSASSKP